MNDRFSGCGSDLFVGRTFCSFVIVCTVVAVERISCVSSCYRCWLVELPVCILLSSVPPSRVFFFFFKPITETNVLDYVLGIGGRENE